jgi:hypothetical protein
MPGAGDLRSGEEDKIVSRPIFASGKGRPPTRRGDCERPEEATPGMARGKKHTILLDWFSISYRTLALVVLGLGALGAAGWFGWQHFNSEKAAAASAIDRAATSLGRAEKLDDDPKIDEIRMNARVALTEARNQFGNANWENARFAAIRSENLSQQALNINAGKGESEKVVRFYRIEGDVRVKRSGEFAWSQADSRMTLGEGDQIKTSSKASAQLIYFDGTVTTVKPGSLLEIRDLYEDPVTKVRRVREKLNWGELRASTQKRNVEGSYHEVTTDKAAARSEEEGEFRVAYDKQDGSGAFDVLTGQIQVASSDRRESLSAGERIRSTATGGLTAKEILPGVPRLISPSDQRVIAHEDPSRLKMTLNWEEVSGASRYELEISRTALFTNLLYDAERTQTQVNIDGVEEGDYYWRVAAISQSGNRGPFTEPRQFRVISQVIRDRGDEIPPELTITEFVPVGSMLIINGATEPGASLWIDSEKVDVSQDGTFYSVVRLRSEGVNLVRFVAQDTAGNETKLQRQAYFEAY